MIDSKSLLADLKKQLKVLQADLKSRADDPEHPWGRRLREQHRAAVERHRTAHPWVTWRDGEIDQAAVAWVIVTTFVRFCEDNGLLDGARNEHGQPVAPLWLAGPGDLLTRAVEHETAFFTGEPTANRRDWMQQAFRVLAAQPAGRALVDPEHAHVWCAEISAEAADALVGFWRATDDAGKLVHDFTDRSLDTRFLGDLYQDLSDYAKKTYALLQTPDFVEEFILDLTLTPAVEEFGLEGLKLIDPTCGSGHFLLGAFSRLDSWWAEQAPGLDVRERVRRAMESIHGVDLNPFAIAIARFRLTVAGLQATGLGSLVEAPEFGYHLAVGDSLLGSHQAQLELTVDPKGDAEVFEYDAEDLSDYHGVLASRKYHVVVGNPPYIQAPDPAANAKYRETFRTPYRKYQLTAPFMELFFLLARRGQAQEPAGYVGMITSNAFMTRIFGKLVVEELLASTYLGNPVDLTHVIDSSGAWIDGHNFDGTPTVMLFGRSRNPVGDSLRVVRGIRGDGSRPPDPARGPVWSQLVDHFDDEQFEGEYLSVGPAERISFASHPWSLAGGGAESLMSLVEAATGPRLGDRVQRIGFFGIIGLDDALVVSSSLSRRVADGHLFRQLAVGDGVRDHVIEAGERVFFPYDDAHGVLEIDDQPAVQRWLWPIRPFLVRRVTFSGNTYEQDGRRSYEWHQLPVDGAADSSQISYAEVATHNHFVLDRQGLAFKQTAPVIKFPRGVNPDVVHGVLGAVNSSVVCFWLKNVSYPKDKNAVPWATRYQLSGTKLLDCPLPPELPSDRSMRISELARALESLDLADVARGSHVESVWRQLRARMIFEQEELDWEVYRLYGLIDDDLTYCGELDDNARALDLGERAFEIELARRDAGGSEATAWFGRHGSTPLTELPTRWPADYRDLVERRIELLAGDRSIGLLERPEHKRRWATPGWALLLRDALTAKMLDRLEDRSLWFDAYGQPLPRSIGELADAVRHDEFFTSCAALVAGTAEVNLTEVLVGLLTDVSVPYLAALRLKEDRVEKYREWQAVWDLQRRADTGNRVDVPLPPNYVPGDFRKAGFWRARGRLDVPNERFIAYPGVVRVGDPTPVIGWAGWDHAEQAQALAREVGTQQSLGAASEQLEPLVAGLVELEPWLDQWHAEIDSRFGTSPAAAIHQTVEHYAAQLGRTRADLDAWRPPASTRGPRKAPAASAGTYGGAEVEAG